MNESVPHYSISCLCVLYQPDCGRGCPHEGDRLGLDGLGVAVRPAGGRHNDVGVPDELENHEVWVGGCHGPGEHLQ